jgi:hypothetical protein
MVRQAGWAVFEESVQVSGDVALEAAARDLTDHADARCFAEVEPENGGWSRGDPQFRAWHGQYLSTVA